MFSGIPISDSPVNRTGRRQHLRPLSGRFAQLTPSIDAARNQGNAACATDPEDSADLAQALMALEAPHPPDTKPSRDASASRWADTLPLDADKAGLQDDPLMNTLFDPRLLCITAETIRQEDLEPLIALQLHQMIINAQPWRTPGALRGLVFNDRLLLMGLIHPHERTRLWCTQLSNRMVSAFIAFGVGMNEENVSLCEQYLLHICQN